MGILSEIKRVELIECFSGIGAQAKALKEVLKNTNIDYELQLTCEWDINSIGSYKAIHYPNDNSDYSSGLLKEELVNILFEKGISSNGKEPLSKESIQRYDENKLRTIYNNIIATKNQVNIMTLKGEDLKITDTNENLYMLTYSFPCTDISNIGQQKGMNRGSNTRSGLLWEIERLLNECLDYSSKLPQVLLMENVSAIHNSKNINVFSEWIEFLDGLGYSNYYEDIIGTDFGIPQGRKRCFMVSILGKHKYNFPSKIKSNYNLKDFLRLDYTNNVYWEEALESQPNDTASRRDIWKREIKIVDEFSNINKYTRTITTKQDRSPNAGVIYFDYINNAKSKFRYLTPRECFLLMGFTEDDFEKAKRVNNTAQLYKQAGNGIVTTCLIGIFGKLFDVDYSSIINELVK